jgi:hypothetical protein
MKITYRRTGGFAPIPVSCSLDTETMPADEAQELVRLVHASGFMKLESRRNSAARDVRLHTIKVEHDAAGKDVSFDDVSIPAEVRPLIQFLQARAKNMLDDDAGD